MSLEATPCPVCGLGTLCHRVKQVIVDIAEYERVMDQPGFWCNHCEEGIIGGTDLLATEAEFQAFRAFVRVSPLSDEWLPRRIRRHAAPGASR